MEHIGKWEKLFKPGKIGRMEVKNRIVFSQIETVGNLDGTITDRTVNFYAERAKGGAGLIIVGGCYIDPLGKHFDFQCSISDDRSIPGLKKLAEAVHANGNGVKVAQQLFHAGRQNPRDRVKLRPPVGPSPIATRIGAIPKELTIEEIEVLVEKYADAARRAQEAGFDAVDIHGAHGYLPSQFMSPHSNKRTDKYGRDVEGRSRFACEIIRRIKEKCGEDFPVMIKINGDDGLVDDGITLEYAKEVAKFLEKAGADAISGVSGGNHDSISAFSVGPMSVPKGFMQNLAQGIKEVVRIPVIAIGRLNDPVLAEKILNEKKADFVAIGRGLIADPEFPNKVAQGRLQDIRPCICCMNCVDDLWRHIEWRCTVNPELWREKELKIAPTYTPKKVLIVGGGPAGMEAARVAAMAGHRVILCEKGDQLGGQMVLAAVPPLKSEIGNLTAYLSNQVHKLGVEVKLETEVTSDLVKEIRPDVVIIATGSVPITPEIPGIERPNVVAARDVLEGKMQVGEKVVVIGGGQVGLETAEFLAQQGKDVAILEILPKMGLGMGRTNYMELKSRFVKLGVSKMLTNVRVDEITDGGVFFTSNDSQKQQLKADNVVIATGVKSERRLLKELEGKGVPQLFIIGDALNTGRILGAIQDAAYTARRLDVGEWDPQMKSYVPRS